MSLRKSVVSGVTSALAFVILISNPKAGAAQFTPRQTTGQERVQPRTATDPLHSKSVAPAKKITKRSHSVNVIIPFQTIRRDSNLLYVGQRHVLTYGVEGVLRRTITFVCVDGHEVRRDVRKTIIRKPVAKVVLVGTRIRPKSRSTVLSGRSEDGFAVIKTLTVEATAYVGGGRTATGVIAAPGVVAVDPSVIPLGTKLYIPGIGVVRAEDTGGAIIGNHIDICMSSYSQADNWGVRTIEVYEIQ